MTYRSAVILLFVLALIPIFVFTDNALAQYLLSPLALYPKSPSTVSHSFSFGDLLTPIATSASEVASASSEIASESVTPQKVTQFLAALNITSQEAKNVLSAFIEKQNTPLRENVFASPIPIPTLVSAVETFTDPVPTYTPKTIAFLQSLTPTSIPPAPTTPEIPSPTGQQTLLALELPKDGAPVAYARPVTKQTVTIAFLGDSMIDTLGPDLPHMKKALSTAYPTRTFALLNYGFGSTDMESGLYRLNHTTNYLGKVFSPLLSFTPDILIVESFAYNHWSGQMSDLNRQWLTIAHIIDTVKAGSPETQIILAATIAPNPFLFGDGILNWETNKKWDAAIVTSAYLQNIINFATSQYYPLIDAYHPSLDAEGHGSPRFINGGDHIHPSDEGKELFAQKTVETLQKYKMIQ